MHGLAAALAAVALLGCAAQSFETVSKLPELPKRPAGTDIDARTRLPESAAEGDTADGLLVLEVPADPAAARATVAAFFRAIVDESPASLGALLTRDALVQSGSRREPARIQYQARFARFDYRSLVGELLYRDSELELWDRAQREGEQPPGIPLEPRGREMIARARVIAPWVGRPRLFADELVFRLVPSGGGWLISEILEDFRAP